jgi:hypothetical protein
MTAIVCGIGLLIVVIGFYGMYRSTKKAKQDYAQATPALAKITAVGDSSVSENYGDVTVDLTLEITPPSGAPYPLTVTWAVKPASIAKLKEGETLKIKIDPKHPQKVFSAEKWLDSLNRD